MSARELRTPVVVGAGQLRANRERQVEQAREPLPLLVAALERAAADTAVPDVLTRADAVHAVHVASWAYADLAGTVAAAVGAAPRTTTTTGLGGHFPVRLLDEVAARIWAGESDVALIVGGEAQASLTAFTKAGLDPVRDAGWSAEPGGPPEFDLDQLGSAAMQAAGLIAPTRVYPLLENRLQADLGLTPVDALAWSAQLYAAMSTTASQHPASWSTTALDGDQIATVTAANRMVCEPYPLSMNAMPHVDQAAAVVVMSLGAARDAGVPEDALVHVWGGAGADDDPDVLSRGDLGGSAALTRALDRCLTASGVVPADLDLVDVYSCFPVVPKLVQLHLGLPRDAPVSVTGGHSSFGGPLNSYSLHALATVVQRLRADGGTGLVHGNGGYATSQHAVLLSSRPHEAGYVGEPQPCDGRAGPAVQAVPAAQAAGDVVVETATVEHARGGGPSQAFVVARTADGTRVATATPDGDADAAAVLSLSRLPAGRTTHVGRSLRLQPLADGTSILVPHPQEQP